MSHHLAGFITGLLDAVNAHDLERTAAFFASEYEGMDVAQAAPHHGPEGIRDNVRRFLQAFPDLRIDPEDLIVEGDRAALVWIARGTHLGSLMNIPPTGRQVMLRGVALLTVRENKVQRLLHIWDVAGFLRAIGLLPDL